MLVDKLLKEESDEAVRRDLLYRQMDDAFATILRQNYFSMFEQTAHDMIAKGAQVGELADAYLVNLQSEFGDSVDISDEFRWEWVMIPHFFNVPFYVYAYAFGQLLVLSLYKQYKAEGESFKPAICRSWLLAAPSPLCSCWPMPALMSPRQNSGRAVMM